MMSSFVLSPKQRYFYNDATAPINIAHGAVRSGKTFIVNLKWLEYIKNGPPGLLLMSGRTKDSLRENVLNDLFEWVGESNYVYQERLGRLRIFDREIEVRGAEKIDAEKVIRGRTYAGWYGDEITIQHKEFVKTAVARCSVPGAQIFWTTNPDHPNHHIRTDFIKNPKLISEGQVKSWRFVLKDNHHLTPEYIKLLENSFSGVFYDRMIRGKWVLAKGIVYLDYYDAETMRVPHDKIIDMCRQGKFVEYIGGVDWGYTHPMAGYIIGITEQEEYYIIAEYYKTQQLTPDLAQWFVQWQNFLRKPIRVIFCDAAEPDRIKVLRTYKLRAKGADKSINAGLNSVMTSMRTGRFFLTDAAVNAHREFGLYRYPDPDDIENPKDLPIDKDNHAMDAIRYAIHNYEVYLNVKRAKKSRGGAVA